MRHRLLKTENIQPLPKRQSKKKKVKKETETFSPKPNKELMPSSTNALIPGADIAFKVLLSARFCSAIWSYIADCDETFNYWEPMHYLVYDQGLQTWEYSPEFALRSYTYLLFHCAPAWFYNTIFHPNPMLIFYFVRCLLGLTSAVIECYFYKAVCREFGIQIGRLWLLFQLFSPGMFTASTALLPSSFSMYLCTAALAAWWHQRYPLAIFFVALSALLGWPFAALIGIPICIDAVIVQKKWRLFGFWAAVSGATVLLPMIAIDSSYFGKLVVAPLNLVIYNVFTSHGPNIYGTEPWTYYFINGFLNFNLAWVLALATPLLLTICYFTVPGRSRPTLYLPYYLSLMPLYIWLAVFMLQPHKEERFLYPIYPMITLCGAISVDVIQKLFYRIKSAFVSIQPRSHYIDHTVWIFVSVVLMSTTLGLSRIASLYFNYHAPLDLYLDMNKFHQEHGSKSPDMTYNVCTGKDWYRFPSSFFLPSTNYRLRFVPSEFDGMLPAYFADGANATSIVHDYFNDANKGDERMLFDVSQCHFMFDLDTGVSSDLEPNYAAQTNEWTVLKQLPFLNTAKSHSILRAFYIPFLTDQHVEYSQIYLLKRKKFRE